MNIACVVVGENVVQGLKTENNDYHCRMLTEQQTENGENLSPCIHDYFVYELVGQ